MRVRIFVIGLIALATSACTTVKRQAAADFQPPQGNYNIIVMRPDIAVSVFTVGGTMEPREDWTNAAREHVLNAIQKQQLARGGTSKVAVTREEAGASPELVLELERLHEAVGQSIKVHKYSAYGQLPTKKGRFDWTLGELAMQYRQASGYDYALFIYARDSFSSEGRQALQAIGVIGCIVGVCIPPAGGVQLGFASLVELRTGNVVWFNYLVSDVGDIRTAAGAAKMVDLLLSSIHDDPKAGKKSKS
jgi:hypothetical protein